MVAPPSNARNRLDEPSQIRRRARRARLERCMFVSSKLVELTAFRPRAKARAIVPLHRAKQFGKCHAQPVRESAYDIEARRSLAALDTAHIGPVQAGALGKFFLGEFPIASELADTAAERQPEVFHDRKRDDQRLGRT